ARARRHRRDPRHARPPLRVLSLHDARAGLASRGRQRRVEPARGHSRRADARARLGPGGSDRRGRRDHDRADRVPRPVDDVRGHALRLRRGSARRNRQPHRRRGGRLHRGRPREPDGRLRHRYGAEVDGRARAHRRRARRQALGSLRSTCGGEGLMVAGAFDRGIAGAQRDGVARRALSVATVVAIVAACAIPLWGSPYQVFQMTLVVIDAIALLGLNLLTGYGGQISLGHGAFFGVGAYTTAVLIHSWNVPYLLTLPCAGLVCLALGFVFGLPAVRLDGLHLALATFALGVVLPQVLKYKGIEAWTGGVQGISLEKPAVPFGLPLSPDQWLYCVALAVAAGLFALARNVMRGATGRVIVGVRDSPVAVSSGGIDTALTKAATFGGSAMLTGIAGALSALAKAATVGLSAMLTGIAGALSALVVQFLGPDSFTIFLSISLLVGIVVGGLASISGAVFGALFIQFVPNLADDVSKAAPSAVYGVVLIVSVYLMPYGVSGLLRKAKARAFAWIDARHSRSVTSQPTKPTKQGS